MRDYYFNYVKELAGEKGLMISFKDYSHEGPREASVALDYDEAFKLLDALSEELGQYTVPPEAYVFTPDWSEKPAEVVVVLDDYRATEGLPPEDEAYDCDGRCINCRCGYYAAARPKVKVFDVDLRPDSVRLAARWQGDGFGPHEGNDVY